MLKPVSTVTSIHSLCVKGQHATWPGSLSAVFHSQLEPKLPKQAVGLQAQSYLTPTETELHQNSLVLLRSGSLRLAAIMPNKYGLPDMVRGWKQSNQCPAVALWRPFISFLFFIFLSHFKDRRGLLPDLEAVGISVSLNDYLHE